MGQFIDLSFIVLGCGIFVAMVVKSYIA